MTLGHRRLLFITLTALSLLWVGIAEAACRPDTVHLRGDWGEARFNVEVVDNQAERSRGLMGRREMPRSSGMLFVYHQTRPVTFWMKNTLIPLDIVFVNEAGVVNRVHHNAIPLDLTHIPSGGPTRYVLEINGGLARALGIKKGTQLRHPAISQPSTAWRCEADQ